jgi:hypothetical protein
VPVTQPLPGVSSSDVAFQVLDRFFMSSAKDVAGTTNLRSNNPRVFRAGNCRLAWDGSAVTVPNFPSFGAVSGERERG